MIEVVAILGFLMAALAAAQWLRARARLREALLGRDAVEQSRAALAAVLDTVPVAALWWRRYLAVDASSPWAARAKRALKYCEIQLQGSMP